MDINIITYWKSTIKYSLFISQLKIQAYVENDNDKLIEDDIVKAISFNDGISVTTDLLVDADAFFGKGSWKKINFKTNSWTR